MATSHAHACVFRTHLCVTASIRQQAEQIKKDLSSSNEVAFSCLLPSSNILTPSSSASTTTDAELATDKLIEFSVTVEDFHRVCDHLFQQSLVPVTRLLTDLDMSKDDIDEVVLVGGTTRIPKIKQQLR
jgi:molecular chaperone DnaK (HSP70)